MDFDDILKLAFKISAALDTIDEMEAGDEEGVACHQAQDQGVARRGPAHYR